MTRFLKNYWNDQSGAAAAEYALILAIVGSTLAVAAVFLGNSIGNALEKAGNQIEATDYTPAP
jgi:pilus assembly protein Flp/PilA